MADVSHELGSIRHIVDTPLSSKVAMFNKVANQHNASQLLNPFANVDGRASPKPSFSKDEYGKPLAGSLTEMRGQKANIHVCKEMLELCQVINSEGFPDQENPDLRIIFFGDLFNIYNYISDKVVGLLLRARKHKLVDFEGEMLFQRRDDEVPIFLTKPIREIRSILEAKQEEFRRSVSPAPQATTVLLDRMQRNISSTRSAPTSKAASPQPPDIKKMNTNISASSLTIDDKPPTGLQTLNSSISTKSIERIINDNLITPSSQNSIKQEKNTNSTPSSVTINIVEAKKIDDKIKVDTKSPSSNSSNSSISTITDSKSEILSNIDGLHDSQMISSPNVDMSEERLQQIVELEHKSNMPVQLPSVSSVASTTDSLTTNKKSTTSDIQLPSVLSLASTADSLKTNKSVSQEDIKIEEFKSVGGIVKESQSQSQVNIQPQSQSQSQVKLQPEQSTDTNATAIVENNNRTISIREDVIANQ